MDRTIANWSNGNSFEEIHFLDLAEIVHPRGSKAAPLLYLEVSGFHATNGSQARAALMLAYRRTEHRFATILSEQSGTNNNQEVRYVTSGPLKSAVVAVNPTTDAPFGYWVTVHRLTRDYRYKRVLRYRSATRYNDGNPLAVIDSEMPNILRRLGLWKAGQPLPLPAGRCPRPHLVKGALWC